MTNNNIKNEILCYVCKLCDYSTSSKDEYDKHLATPKHITTLRTTDTNYITKPETIKTWKCECGKEYKHQSSLWNHKQICKYKDEQAAIKKKEEELDTREMYAYVIDENKELRDIIIDQQKTINNQNKQIALYISDMEYTPFDNSYINLG